MRPREGSSEVGSERVLCRIADGATARRGKLAFSSLVATLLVALAPSSALALKAHVFSASFGESGSGSGQFSGPVAVAVEEVALADIGDVYVVDKGNKRVEQFTASGTIIGEFDGSETPAGEFSEPEAIAIDNSSNPLDPSRGDVYVADRAAGVIDKFAPDGTYLGQITTGAEGAPLGEVLGVAVDTEGKVWVFQASKEIDDYSSDEPNLFLASRETPFAASLGFAVDSQDDLYANRGSKQMAKLNGAGERLVDSVAIEEQESTSGAAVEIPSDDVYLPTVSEPEGTSWSVAHFTSEPTCHPEPEKCVLAPADALRERFGGGDIVEAAGIAVNSATSTVYVADHGADAVRIFVAVPLPTVTASGPTNVGPENARLRGSINPEGEALTECVFEYGTDTNYGQTAPCEAPDAAEVGTGVADVPVHADVTGLTPRTVYHYRLIASNVNGTTTGDDRSFFTVTAPLVEAQSAASTNSIEAQLVALVDAAGLPTTYQVEFGPTNAYGQVTVAANLGSSQTPVSAPARITGLAPNTTYHFRYVATNALGTTDGVDTTFTTANPSGGLNSPTSCPNSTYKGFSASLPDCRGYELVSTDNPGEVYVPNGPLVVGGTHEEAVPTELPMQVADNGDSATYVGDPGVRGGSGSVGAGLGDQFLARRSGAGTWSVETITPQSALEIDSRPPEFSAFAADLSSGVLGANSAISSYLSTKATPPGPDGCNVLFTRDADGSYHALYQTTSTPGFCGLPTASQQGLLFAGGNRGTSSVPAYSDLLVQTPAALDQQAVQTAEGEEGNNLYVSAGGETHSVNVLPGGQPAPDSVFGGPSNETLAHPNFDEAISADGSRLFWTDLDTAVGPDNPGGQIRLFARENPLSSSAQTIELDLPSGGSGDLGGGRFWSASDDGSKVLFTDESKLTANSTAEPGAPNLYLYDFDRPQTDRLVDLTPDPGAGVQGVVGTSSDASYVYFTANGALAANENSESATAEPRECIEAEGGGIQGTPSEEEEHGHLPSGIGCNLYVLHAGETRFIAALAAKDNNFGRESHSNRVSVGDWQPELGARTAEVTPSGRGLVFASTQQLTHYDNSVLLNIIGEAGTHPERTAEVFVYNATSGPVGKLRCASCAASGEPPTQENKLSDGTYLPISLSATYLRRWLSEDGARVFFNSSQPLVSQDSNQIQDVYEWEEEETPGCPQATSASGGCVFLLSGGQSSNPSYLIDADATGDNVFFTHRGQLAEVGAPVGKTDLIDARVAGGVPEIPTGCFGPSCPASPSPAPSFASPPSVTITGGGNVNPSPVNSHGPGKGGGANSRAKQLAKALRACRKKHNRHKRAKCEASARKRFGPVAHKKKAKHNSRPASTRSGSRGN
jgi:hypothetical protein